MGTRALGMIVLLAVVGTGFVIWRQGRSVSGRIGWTPIGQYGARGMDRPYFTDPVTGQIEFVQFEKNYGVD